MSRGGGGEPSPDSSFQPAEIETAPLSADPQAPTEGPASETLPPSGDAPSEQGELNIPLPAEAAPREAFEELPPVQEVEPQGRVLGGRKAVGRPAELEAYEETIVVGGDPQREPPPPPPVEHAAPPEQGMQETMAAPPPPPPPAIDKEIIAQAEAQAAQMIHEAQLQCQNMVNEASAHSAEAAEQARQQAAQQGYEEGMQAGLQQGQQQGLVETQERVHLLKEQFVELVKVKRQVAAEMEPQIVDLALSIARRVVGDELKTNREVIVGIVRQGLSTLQERDEILIRVNPAEADTVRGHQTEYEAMIEGLKKFTIQADGAIELGSCAIETNLGNVDARIETQFEAIRIGLDEMRKIRSFETEERLLAEPVEVPGDPEFHQRMKEQAAHGGPPVAHAEGHGHAEGPPPEAQHQEHQHAPSEVQHHAEEMSGMMINQPPPQGLEGLTPEQLAEMDPEQLAMVEQAMAEQQQLQQQQMMATQAEMAPDDQTIMEAPQQMAEGEG